ncbi:MAG: DUF512 domain-containing protein [Clostridium sp.]|nr:DUF512 domain-containing protein [Clostridium sp.]MCM1209778.1 DUF512 domain-containing protein [Ruminococcus sp.]
MSKYEHKIKAVYPGSIAEELEIEAGDVLLAINKEAVSDVFDYRYLINDEYIEVLIRKADGEEWLLEIEKEFDEDLGIEFENDLMSEYKSCHNKCIFCFIDQMPPNMRETLYFKDDDSRLSFLQGNYITLTNMTDEDIDRIIKMQLAPINISVQSTNKELRCKLLNNRFAGDKLNYIDRLYEGHVEMNGQIVCCKGVNDGEELLRSIEDLSKYLPFMKSVSVVPAGITKYREGLYPIELFNKKEAEEIIDMVEAHQKKYYEEFGLHFIHASDEFYILAERELPEEERYDGYIQLENGVGMMRLLMTEFEDAFSSLKKSKKYKALSKKLCRTVTIATGKLAYLVIKELADKLMGAFETLSVNVCCIRNDFFGETITVSGLITGQDLIKQLQEKKASGYDLGDTLIIPANMLRTGEKVFLDDITTDDVKKALGISVVAAETNGYHLIEAVLNREYEMDRINDAGFVYIKGYR